jgi:hypothetical protein
LQLYACVFLPTELHLNFTIEEIVEAVHPEFRHLLFEFSEADRAQHSPPWLAGFCEVFVRWQERGCAWALAPTCLALLLRAVLPVPLILVRVTGRTRILQRTLFLAIVRARCQQQHCPSCHA